MSVKKDRVNYGAEFLIKSQERIRLAEKALEIGESYSNVISDCQECMELCVKAIFKFMDVDFQPEHSFSFDDEKTHELLSKDFPKSFEEEFGHRIPRSIFLTQFWSEFYLPSKYGKENLNIPPFDLFEKEEVELALDHAKECRKIATELHIHIQDKV